MNKTGLKIFDTAVELAEGFAEILCSKIQNLLINKEKLNIALSGGNTPIDLFKILAEDYKYKISWNSINFYWVDERCTEPESNESNYGNSYRYLFSRLDSDETNLNRIRGEADPEDEAVRYSETVKAKLNTKNNLPCFDIILLGIGDDGHTASIFPNHLELLSTDNIYAVSVKPATGEKRITITGRIINNADNIYFLAAGKNKAKVMSDIINNRAEAEKYPAYYIKPTEGNIFWYMDKGAASLL